MAKILIVDDSRTSRKILREVLEEAGHEIVGEAANGEEGIIMYKELKPDAVTMDITMPVMNGLDALAIIKKEDWKKVQEILSVHRAIGRVTTLRRLTNSFVVTRAKHPLFKGFFVLDPRWTAADRREFIKIIDEAQNLHETKGE